MNQTLSNLEDAWFEDLDAGTTGATAVAPAGRSRGAWPGARGLVARWLGIGALLGGATVGGLEATGHALRADATAQAATAAAIHPEAAALDRARAALAAGDASHALGILNAYDRSFPEGSLKLEAVCLRIQTLLRAGNHLAARNLAVRFLGEHPNSSGAAVVRRLLSDPSMQANL